MPARGLDQCAYLVDGVLRLAAEGVDTVPALSQVLGISEQIVSDSVADQLFLNRLVRTNLEGGLLKLTAVGTELARDMASVLPREEVLGYGFDMMMRRVTAFPSGILMTATQANQNGLRRLPQATNLVGDGDLTAADLNQLLRESTYSRSEVEILDCRRILQQASCSCQLSYLSSRIQLPPNFKLASSSKGKLAGNTSFN